MPVTSLDGENELELFVNDLSIAGQFPDVPAFLDAIGRIMKMRSVARQFGRDFHCHRNIVNAQVTRNMIMLQALQVLEHQERRAILQWFTHNGPFWDDDKLHSSDDYFECNEQIVTDTAIGEVGHYCYHGADQRLVTLTPSSWEFSPLTINWVLDAESTRHISIVNYWEQEPLEEALRSAPAQVESWEQLAEVCQTRCPDLTFVQGCFEPLRGYPFVVSAAERILILLDTLARFRRCSDEQGQRTKEGQQIYQDHFTGKSWFSDSSDSEKHQFREALTFRNPEVGGENLFCTWHGKVKTPQIRIHFSWPVSTKNPLYVVYVGPKITKR